MSTTGWIILIVTILVLVAMIVGIVFLYKKAKKQYHPEDVTPFVYAHHVVCALES